MSEGIPLLDLRREYEEIETELRREWAAVLCDMRLLAGEQVRLFEREIACYMGVTHVCGVASGTDALLLGLRAVGIGAGDRVVLAANGFIAAVEAIRQLGAVPVLVDVVADGFAPDPDQIEAAMPARAVLLVHLHGRCFDVRTIEGARGDARVSLVEDASHAHGAVREGRHAGSMGDVGCFSAGVVKSLGAYGDAGFIVTNSPDVDRLIRRLRCHGQAGKNNHRDYGTNSRLDELQAAVLRVKLRRLDRRNARRREIAAYYNERFAPLDLRIPSEDEGETMVYHQYVLRVVRRDALRSHLHSHGVATGVHYPVPLHRQPAWLRCYGETPALPRCERLAREIVSLPIFPDLSDREVEMVAGAVRKFFR